VREKGCGVQTVLFRSAKPPINFLGIKAAGSHFVPDELQLAGEFRQSSSLPSNMKSVESFVTVDPRHID
jgi:hypothetical protein